MNKTRWRYIFRKSPNLRFKRAEAYWAFGKEFYGFHMYATKDQFLAFMKDMAGIERSLRDILKEEEFKLPFKADAKRYEKASEFKKAQTRPKME